MPKTSEIYSIFGQIESVVAQQMVEEGLVNRIAPEHIPVTVQFNDQGQRAKFAVVVPADMVALFDKRVADLRA